MLYYVEEWVSEAAAAASEDGFGVHPFHFFLLRSGLLMRLIWGLVTDTHVWPFLIIKINKLRDILPRLLYIRWLRIFRHTDRRIYIEIEAHRMAGRVFPAPYTTYAELAELLTVEVGWFVDEKNLRQNFCRYTKTQSLRADVLRRLAQIG